MKFKKEKRKDEDRLSTAEDPSHEFTQTSGKIVGRRVAENPVIRIFPFNISVWAYI